MENQNMDKQKGKSFLSRLERERFNMLAGSMTVKDAAQKLGLAPGTLYNWLDKLRDRLVKERGHINACLGQTRRSQLLRKELSTRRPLEKYVTTEISLQELESQVLENGQDSSSGS